MQLLDLPDNPCPPGAELVFVVTQDGVTLRAAHWPAPDGKPRRGSVLLLQGRAEFIEKSFETVGELLGRGYAVTTFDWRGQGGSDRALADRHKGHIRHFRDFRADYEAVRARFPAGGGGLDLVLAHSMGGCVALTGAAEGWLRADALVALSPMVALSLVPYRRLAHGLAKAAGRLGLADRFVPGGIATSISRLPFPGNRLTNDPGRYARNAALATALDFGAVGSPTFGWLLAAYEAMAVLARPEAAAAIATPTLVVAAGNDPVCSTPAIRLFARALRQGALLEIAGARHEILHETDARRATFWAAFDAFAADPAGYVAGPGTAAVRDGEPAPPAAVVRARAGS